MVKNKITIPFIYSDPSLDRLTFPLKGFVWSVYFVLLGVIMACTILSFPLEDGLSSGYALVLFCIAVGLGLICMIAVAFIDKYFMDHIVIENNQIVYEHSRILVGKKERYPIGPESKVVWSVELRKINYVQVRYHTLILIGLENKKNILIKQFSIGRGYKKYWKHFLNNLEYVSGLKVEREEIRV